MTSFTSRIRKSSPQLQKFAKQMRRDPTPAEALLWEALRNKQLDGFKFRRQHPMGRFIVDFYCAQCRLVIEVDGKIHEVQKERDAARTASIEQFGCRVIRFSNEQVLENLTDVVEQIREYLVG